MSTKPLDERARDLTDLAVDTLEDVMCNGVKDSDRIKAAESILDRGHGKAAQAIIHIPSTQRMQAQLASMTDDQLVAIIEQKIRPAPQAMITIDSTANARDKAKDPAYEIYADAEDSALEHPLLQ